MWRPTVGIVRSPPPRHNLPDWRRFRLGAVRAVGFVFPRHGRPAAALPTASADASRAFAKASGELGSFGAGADWLRFAPALGVGGRLVKERAGGVVPRSSEDRGRV